MISREGVTIDPRLKQSWIVNVLTTVHEVKSFLGLVSYYRRFVEGFSRLSSSLMVLIRKNAKLIWTETCEKSFEKLKRRLTTAPVLALLESHKPFAVYNDA